MQTIGRHITIDMYGCSAENLNNLTFIQNVIFQAIKDSNMTLLNFTHHQFKPQGLTLIALLSQSHMSIHTYPELRYAAIDVFTCGINSRPEKAVATLKKLLKPEKIKTTNIKRGDFGKLNDMKPKIKVSIAPLRRVKNTTAKVFKILNKSR